MKSSAKIILYVALLLAIVTINAKGESITNILNKMAEKGKSIGCIFKPWINGSIDDGVTIGVVYEGTLLLNSKDVAMKFTLKTDKYKSDKEYKIYTYLNAINNPDVEAFGVPAIYYYGTWEDYTMLAMSLPDKTFNSRFQRDKFTRLDVLIAVRDFVRISKYIHSRGVRLSPYFNLRHFMYRKHVGFIFTDEDCSDFINYIPERKLWEVRRNWQHFYTDMSARIRCMRWIGYNDISDNPIYTEDVFFKDRLLKDSGTPEKFDGLRKVFAEFVKYAHGDEDLLKIPFYDLMYKTVVQEIEKLTREERQPPVFSWLSEEDKEAAMSAIDSIPPIEDIRNPFGSDEVDYMELNYDFFTNLYAEQLKAGAESNPKSKKCGLTFRKKKTQS